MTKALQNLASYQERSASLVAWQSRLRPGIE